MIFNFEQRSDEWFEVRRGKFTGSKFYNLMSKDTTSSYQNLINEVVYERLTNKTLESYQSADMLRGTELEPEAREDYEFVTGNKVEEVGFVSLDEWVGVSPDGLISDDGMVEIKCTLGDTRFHPNIKMPKNVLSNPKANKPSAAKALPKISPTYRE
jgi:hypothetical protein